ncbi:MAG TPA: fibronectin type III domain-containing protein [Anaerolineae bacterium]|nr:fibronectin type III domain-containing protein [Anaerolineae bacterium]
MKLIPRYTVISLLILAFALGLALLLASAQSAVAEPVSITPLPPVEETDGHAGACFSYYHDPHAGSGRPFLQKALDAGSRWDRFPFDWWRIEPTDGNWAPSVKADYDDLVDDLSDAGMDMVGILLGTPGWAASGRVQAFEARPFDQRPPGWYAPVPHADSLLAPQAVSAFSSPPRGLYEEWNDWTTTDGDPINYWGRFVYDAVHRYGDRVKHWEMWNEPEWSYFWTGTSADYARLLKVGYQATKAACPDCTVLFGGLHYWLNTSYYRWVLSTLAQDPDAPQNNYFFDAMSVHLYSRSSSIYDEVINIRNGMSAYHVADHPIWLTETGVPVWNDARVDPDPTKYDFAATGKEAAAYVIQSYANAWAVGIGRYFFFRVHDHDMSEYFGLIRNDYTLRPAYVAYQVATTYLVSPTFVTRAPTGSDVRVTLWGTPRGKVSVLWNGSPATSVYTLPATLDSATLVDRWGITRTMMAIGDVYTCALPGATANRPAPHEHDYIIGGEPVIVVETETPNAPPTSTVHPLPEVTCLPTFTVTWEGQDNQAGVWRYDVQLRDGVDGEWVTWQDSVTATSAQFTGLHGHTYYFRSRATDRVGNREAWPKEPQAYTRVDLLGTLTLSVGGFFADENRNGVWDRPITATGEITLTSVTLRFVNEAGEDVVSPTVGSAWTFTTTVYAGQTYQLWATSADHMRALSFAWAGCGEVHTETYPALGLRPVTRTYLPLTARSR